MSAFLQISTLTLVLVAAMLMVPFGLPGLWVMLGATIVYWILVPTGGIGLVTFGVVAALVVIAEVLEFTVSARYARKYGGSRRASWGAILGGIAGAVVGVPIPVIGSLIGAFAGSFIGAFVAEYTVRRETRGNPGKVATGALVGRAMAAALKVAIGLVVLVLVLARAIWG